MKKLFKRLLALLLIVTVVAGVLAAPYIKEGYAMYRQAVEQMPIADKVEEIRSSDAYTPFEEISPVFVMNCCSQKTGVFISILQLTLFHLSVQ